MTNKKISRRPFLQYALAATALRAAPGQSAQQTQTPQSSAPAQPDSPPQERCSMPGLRSKSSSVIANGICGPCDWLLHLYIGCSADASALPQSWIARP